MPTGSLRKTSRGGELGAHFEWRIEGWTKNIGQYALSPDFSFAGTDWRLALQFPKIGGSRSLVSVYRSRSPDEPVRCWLGIRRTDGVVEEIGSGTLEPGAYVVSPWLPRMELERREEQLAPSGTLTVLVKMTSGPETETLHSVLKELRDLQKQHKSSLLELQTTKRQNKLLEQEKANLAVQLEERRGDMEKLNDLLVLQEHFKKLLLSADDHDVALRVQTKEFRAHKSVLRARSPVFEAMFRYGMKESTENSVDIEDCDPDCFGEFLQYIYTGQVQNLSPRTALGLYFCGDKYELTGPKRRCVDLLQSSLLAPLVCDIITLAVTHGEEELLETAMDYVSRHLDEVTKTVEWQRLSLSNPIQANELCSKAVKGIRTSTIQQSCSET